jgi:hypothetical protein
VPVEKYNLGISSIPEHGAGRMYLHLASRTSGIVLAAASVDSPGNALSYLAHAGKRGRQILGVTAPAPRREDELPVGVPVDV